LERPDLISAYLVSVGEFPEMAEDYGVDGVPHTVVNKRHSLVGLQQDAPFAEFVLNPGGAAPSVKLDMEQGFNPGDDDVFGGADFTAESQVAPEAQPETESQAAGKVQVPEKPQQATGMAFSSGIASGASEQAAKAGAPAGQLGVVREKGDEFNCDLLILGGGPAGLTAAVYGARSGLDVTLLDSGMLGGQVLLTPLVENYPGFKGMAGVSLAESMVEHARQYAHLRGNLQITNLQKINEYFVASTSNGEYRGRALLIATGSSWRKLGIPGELVFSGRGVHNCASCDGYIYVGKKIAVVGGGNAALTDALHLRNLGIDVSIIHRRDQFRGEDALAEAVIRSGVNVLWDSVPLEILGREKLSGLKIKNVKTDAEQVLDVDGVFVCVGHEPNSRPAKAVGAALNRDGSIAVDAQMRASVPLVYAAGDVTGGFLQIVMAVAKGAQAAHTAFVDLQQN
jgi:thioredoxin reductase (NADPH)